MKTLSREEITAKLEKLMVRDVQTREQFQNVFAKNPADAIKWKGDAVAIYSDAGGLAKSFLEVFPGIPNDLFEQFAMGRAQWLADTIIQLCDSKGNEVRVSSYKLAYEAFTSLI